MDAEEITNRLDSLVKALLESVIEIEDRKLRRVYELAGLTVDQKDTLSDQLNERVETLRKLLDDYSTSTPTTLTQKDLDALVERLEELVQGEKGEDEEEDEEVLR